VAISQKPPRTAWGSFPDVLIHASESLVKQHLDYIAAKSGDIAAARQLIVDTFSQSQVDTMLNLGDANNPPILVSAHALESAGINAIPEAFAMFLAQKLAWPVESGVVQTNVVSHTGSDGYGRLSRQPLFAGKIEQGKTYFLVDDFVGMGGTLANLKGYIESKGGIVVGATALTGKTYSAKLKISQEQLDELRSKHPGLEQWWKSHFDHTFDALTESEARYLARSKDADTIRNRIIAAEQS